MWADQQGLDEPGRPGPSTIADEWRIEMFKPLRQMAADPEGKVLVGSAGTTIAVGTVVYTVLEGWSILDSLYFSVVTLATVGFGDLTPTTDAAKLFTIGYIITGIGILAAFASELTKRRSVVEIATGSRVVALEDDVAHAVEQAVDRGDSHKE
jgi:hypothetical protein